MVNKDVTHPKMKRRIENPRIMLLDCNLEYKKGESQVIMTILFARKQIFMLAIIRPTWR
jgi:chaperonin GroEL (HSP60 family)